MKVYNLSCEQDHRFEGWFASEDDYAAQLAHERIECPVCESRAVRKLPSAPRLNLSSAPAPHSDSLANAQSQAMQALRQIVARTEDVGERFAEEARRIHYNEVPERPIRGMASVSQCEALVEEGVNVMMLPLPAALKQPLQ